MTPALEVLPYAVGFTLAALACLGAGVLIAKALTGPADWTVDDPCDEWIVAVVLSKDRPPSGEIWRPCPHRRPCPLHDTDSRRTRGRQI